MPVDNKYTPISIASPKNTLPPTTAEPSLEMQSLPQSCIDCHRITHSNTNTNISRLIRVPSRTSPLASLRHRHRVADRDTDAEVSEQLDTWHSAVGWKFHHHDIAFDVLFCLY